MRFGIPLIETSGGGSIISTSSIGALQGIPTTGPYSAAKYGAHSLTRTCAAEVASKNIRVNCIIPGAITTRFALPSDAEQTEEDLRARRERGARISRMARSGDPEEIATLALFLACDDSSFITGQCIAADGGMTSVNGWIQDRGEPSEWTLHRHQLRHARACRGHLAATTAGARSARLPRQARQ